MNNTKLKQAMITMIASLLSVTMHVTTDCAAAVREGPKQLQVAYDVDVVVAGGSTYAVAAAVSAAQNGASVFLLTDRPYLGEDLCMTMRYELDPALQKDTLVKAIWQGKSETTPLTIKKKLDLALLDAGVYFLTGSYPQELVTDEEGRFAGITMVSRSGRHFIKAKVLIDATDQGILTRQSKAPFTPLKPGPVEFTFRVAGGKPVTNPELQSVELPWQIPFRSKGGKGVEQPLPVMEYRHESPLERGDWQEISKVEQTFRTLCRQRGMAEWSERMSYHLGIRLQGAPPLANWPGAQRVDLEQFYHADFPRLLVLGKYAALSTPASKKMLEVQEAVTLGRRLGTLAARQASDLPAVNGSTITGPAANTVAEERGEFRTASRDLRTDEQTASIKLDTTHLPVLGTYDVVVVGGGTSGAPATLGALEHGAKTLVIEYLDELGGVGTAGLISKYWYGLRQGYTKRVDQATLVGESNWKVVDKSEWLRTTIQKAGGEIWYRSYGCGALVNGDKVVGIIVATPFGRGVVLAKTVVDSTGNSDIPYHAGSPTRYSIDSKGIFSVQMAGYPLRNPGENQNNTCYALVDDCDAIDVWHLMMSRRHDSEDLGNKQYFDVGQLLDSRERRRIIGDYTLTTQDILTQRTFPDTLLQMRSNFDAAAFPNSPMLLIKDMKGPVYTTNMPYRCFLPQGLDGILSTGLGASAERDAMTLVRMQPDLQNQGYAIGIAASLAAQKDGATRYIDIGMLQKLVIRQGILSPKSYGQKDSFPLPKNEIVTAVQDVGQLNREINQGRENKQLGVFTSLAKIVGHPEIAIPALKRYLADTDNRLEQVNYACVLAMLGDDSGAEVLIREIASRPWGEGFGLTTHRETHNTYTDLDRMVMALGSCHGERAREMILQKLAELTGDSALSHFLAVSIALRDQPGPDMAQPLLKLLDSPDFTGHASTYSQAYADGTNLSKVILERKNTSTKHDNQLNQSLKELMVAGMLYAVGDHDGRGEKILLEYKQEISGQLSRYASYLLAQQPDKK